MNFMFKKVEAIIRPEKLDIVKNNLENINCKGLTVSNVKGRGKQLGIVEKYRGNVYNVDLISKIKLDIITTETEVEKIVDTIKSSAFTGNVGDGKIFVSDIEDIIRIRTGERGVNAIKALILLFFYRL